MNTRPPLEAPDSSPVLSVAFNSNDSLFSVGTNTGFATFSTESSYRHSTRDLNAGLGLVQIMGQSQFLALVGGGRSPKFPQNKVIIWDDTKAKVSLEISALTAVRGVQLTRHRVVVVLQNSVRVYAFEKHPKPLATYETADNHHGLCCLTEKYLVFPGRTPGQVQVVHLATGDSVSIIPAHNSSLRALQLSQDGKLLATASEKGTIIRIFATSSCAKIAERRRGSDSATIFSLRFNPSGSILACTSDKGSLHVFDVPNERTPQRAQTQNQAPGTSGGTTEVAKNAWGFLANIPFGPFTDTYSFASARFEMDDDGPYSSYTHRPVGDANTVLGTSRPMKGIIGWINDNALVVLGAGRDAKWEKFVIGKGDDEVRFIAREGWKRYYTH